jgi:superfamily II DNA or RNA helicase
LHNINLWASAFDCTFEDEEVETPTELGQDVASEFDVGGDTYKSKTVPFPHQNDAESRMEGKDAFALFMEQGTGKTKVAIDRAGRLFTGGRITGLLVMAKKGVHRQWVESEIPAHFGAEWEGDFWPTPKKTIPDKLLEVGGPLKVFTINWDGAKTKHGLEACLQFVRAHEGNVLIVGDETQEIKNARSGRWIAAKKIVNNSGSLMRLALTGTPVAKDLSDEWAQLKWLNENILGIRYVSAFRNEYCVMGGFEGRSVIGTKNMERFRSKVDPFTFRATKDEIGILPKTYRRWAFDQSPAQKRVIQEMRKTLEHQIDTGEIVSAANAAVAMIKIQQASNGFVVDEDGKTHWIVPVAKNPRLLALQEILNAYEGPTIIWARFRNDMKAIAEMLSAAGETFVQYHGGTSDKDRASGVQDFLNGDARIFLSNPQAGGTGLNLQTGGCTQAIYYSNSYNAIDRWQSEDRIHRIGTVGSCVYTDIVAKGSIDAAILANLKRKQGLADLAIGDIRKILEEMG